jgi:hypothetical protein
MLGEWWSAGLRELFDSQPGSDAGQVATCICQSVLHCVHSSWCTSRLVEVYSVCFSQLQLPAHKQRWQLCKI